MSNHPESDIGELVPLEGATCTEIEYDRGDVLRGWYCGGQLQVYANTRPPRAVVCSRCGHVSYEVIRGDAA